MDADSVIALAIVLFMIAIIFIVLATEINCSGGFIITLIN